MYQIRKLERYSVIRHSETAFLDPDDFRQYGYTGDTEQQFLEFIENFDLDLDLDSRLDEAVLKEILKLKKDQKWTECYFSYWDGEDSWHELGKESQYASMRNGYFDAHFTTIDEYRPPIVPAN